MVRKPKRRRSNAPLIIERLNGTYGMLGYRSASRATREGRTYSSYPASTHDEHDRTKLIAQSRDFMRNNAIYKGMIDRAVGYIVGGGFELQVNTRSANVNTKVEQLWRQWFAKPEVRNLLSGSETARIVCREVMVAGDTVVLLTDKALVQLFEAEQLTGRSPYKNGIARDKYGRPTKYNLCPWKSYGIDSGKGTQYDAADVLFLARPERPSQIRGVPAAQAAFAMLHRINDICDSEAIAWQLLARLAVSITREQATEQAYTESREDPNKTGDETEGDLATRLTELDYALMFHANPGEEVKGIERNIPGKNFGESLRMFVRLLGLPLGLPLELILLDWTQSNYSQSRAVLQQAYQSFLEWQHKLQDFFYRPLMEWKLAQWRSQGLVGEKTAIGYDWIKPTFPWIDQLKEATAYATQVERGFITHGQVCKSLNTDRQEIVERREREVRDAIRRAKKIKADEGIEVPWEIFAGLKPSKDKATLAKPAESKPPPKEGDK
jgi:lambda family phage portal protein